MRAIPMALMVAALATVIPAWADDPEPEGDPPADAVAAEEPAQWWQYLPALGATVEGGVAGVFNADGAGRGLLDLNETGFAFRFLQLGLSGDWVDLMGIEASLVVTGEEVVVERAWAEVHGLPWDVTVRAGLLPTRAGFANARGPTGYLFVDQPLALGKMFGPLGHLAAGADLAFTLPVPWTLRLFAGMTAAEGPGMRSWYGDQHVPVEEIRDFGYQLGLENEWEAGGLGWALELTALLGPNPSGRSNDSDVFALAFALRLPSTGEGGVTMDLETEWFLRRRQRLADNLFDWGGWASVYLTVDEQWHFGARYDVTEGIEQDPLDPLDDERRHKVTGQIGWHPYDFGGVRLAASYDSGGALTGRSAAVMLLLRAGWRVDP